MDVAELFLAAAAVLDIEPDEVFDRADLDAIGRTFRAVPSGAPALEQAAALLHAIIRERPFGDDSAAIGIITAAHMLELEGHVITFKPSDELFALLNGIADGSVEIDDVCSFLALEVSSMFERFTTRARSVITYAYSEAKEMRHNYVGTEHLLLGLLREGTGIGALVLTDMGVDVDVVRREVEHRVGRGTTDVPDRSPFTPRSKRVLELALNEAIQMGHNYIGTEHQLLGLLRVDDGVAAQILTDVYSVEVARVRSDIITRLMAIGQQPQRAKRRSRPFLRPPVTWAAPVDPALIARRTRLLGDVQALLDENGRLREENAHLRALLHEHGIDLGGEAGAEPA
jgi:Clp amino terminal domain, pathogenicity island component